MNHRIPIALAAALLLVAALAGCGERGEPKDMTAQAPIPGPAAPSPSSNSTADSNAAAASSPSGSAAPTSSAIAEPTNGASPAAEARIGEDGKPRMIEQGTVAFRGSKESDTAQLPLVAVAATYGADDGPSPPSIVPEKPLEPIDFAIPREQADTLAAYWMNLGFSDAGFLVIGPKGWIATSAAVGANGSYGLSLANPEDESETLTTYDTGGGCQGCAISSIGSYFPKLAKWAEEQAFPGDPIPYKDSKEIGEHVIEFTLESELDGYETRGAAYETRDGGAQFGSLRLTAAKERNALVGTILSFYEGLHAE